MKYLRQIWRDPRSTIRLIVDSNPGYLFYPLAAVFWAANGLYFVWDGFGAYWEHCSKLQLVALYLAFGVFCGPLLFILAAYPVHWACSLVGGTGKVIEVRSSLAWSSVPYFPSFIVMAVIILIGPSIYVLFPGYSHRNAVAVFGAWGTVYSYYQLFRVVVIVWSIYIATMCISEIERISILKALLVIVLLAIGAYGSLMEIRLLVGIMRGIVGGS